MNDNEALVAMKIYQQRHGGNLAEISILFANVVSALKEAAQQGVQADVCPSCGVDDWAYGDDTNTFEVCAMCGKRR